MSRACFFEGPYQQSIDVGPSYAVSPDARRFLMARQPNIYPLRATELAVVQNWFEDVRRLTAAAKRVGADPDSLTDIALEVDPSPARWLQ